MGYLLLGQQDSIKDLPSFDGKWSVSHQPKYGPEVSEMSVKDMQMSSSITYGGLSCGIINIQSRVLVLDSVGQKGENSRASEALQNPWPHLVALRKALKNDVSVQDNSETLIGEILWVCAPMSIDLRPRDQPEGIPGNDLARNTKVQLNQFTYLPSVEA
ncbi:hypothetical protein FB451DRAFT_1170196 [Mycena latifolia]|nr:hypothetical protein FB451DRAFT_1170196 [Mycena latifolia]